MAINGSNMTPTAEPWSSGPVEAYSAVLSATALVLAVVLGGGGSLSILLALFQSQHVRKYSYTLVLVFFFLCCALDLLWSPMELAHLLTYHHHQRHPTLDFGVATFTVYIFLSTGMALLIAAFCMENVLRLVGRFGSKLRQVWPLSVCVITLVLSLVMALTFLYTSMEEMLDSHQSYLILHASSSATRISLLTLLVVVVVVGAVGVVISGVMAIKRGAVKSSQSFLSAQSNDSNSVPRFLVNQTAEAGSSEDVDKRSVSASSSKLPDIIGGEVTPATPIKDRSPPRLGGLPAAAPKAPTMLGVNMAQVLGRRRHTICQIGDSNAPPDPISKAKQYNYVRKFSVDISALQAQLENPKMFKDTLPFASHQDLRQRQQQQGQNKPESRPPLLPLPNLKPKPELVDESEGIALTVPARPPVITVSEDMKEDVEGEIKEEEEVAAQEVLPDHERSLNSTTAKSEYKAIVDKASLTDIPCLPVVQPVDDDDDDEYDEEEGVGVPSAEDNGDETSYKSNNNRLNERDQDFVKMTLLMTLTFFLCVFPLFLIEAMKASVHPHTYVNISTCTRALSTIQTIIYPHIIVCMDRVVHHAVRRLKGRVTTVCFFKDRDCLDIAPEPPSSNTSQM